MGDSKNIGSLDSLYEKIFEKHNALLVNIKRDMPALEKLLSEVDSHWGSEDLIYRYYHGSFKVYRIQNLTRNIYTALEEISPHKKKKIRNERYLKIINEGAKGRAWKPEDNQDWDNVCRPFLEAFFHSKYFLQMAVKYGKEYKKAPRVLHSGWAALLELYGIR